MDNKLSELSKPIGVAFKSDIELMQSGRMIHGQMTVWRGCAENQVTEGVYSQEYVSALLEEMSVRERSLISNCVDYEYDLIEMKRRAEAAEQRVAELEQAMKEQRNG